MFSITAAGTEDTSSRYGPAQSGDSALATIVSVQRFSTEDGPGIRTTVFFKGCPMHCLWCQNPETIEFAPEIVWHGGRCLGDGGCIRECRQNALRFSGEEVKIARDLCRGCGTCVEFCPAEALELQGKRIGVEELFEWVRRDVTFYETSGGGVTLSGGEPLAQPQAAIGLLRRLRQERIHTALDTCGAVSERALTEALEWTDLVLLDIKTVDPERHERYTGVTFDRVAASALLVAQSKAKVWVRTPIIPGHTDDEDGVLAVARFVRETLPRCERHDLLAFSNLCRSKYQQLERPFVFANAHLLSAVKMEHLCTAVRAQTNVPTFWSGPTELETTRRPRPNDM